ncbi:MAG TPA: diacylglycerol kinase family protein [Bacteroidales bacterium]|nr:diacylglycerol kinase family protein [Bacteroidales bacterium]
MESRLHKDAGRWLVVVNPNAGSRKGEKDWPEIRSLLDGSGFAFDHVFTKNRRHAIEVTASMINSKGYRNIIVVGGDGTLNEVVNGVFMQTKYSPGDILIGMIPVGTGNDWCRMYKIPMQYRQAVEIISKGHRFTQDVGFVSYHDSEGAHERYFINVSGMGYDALVAQKTNRMKDKGWSGSFTYLLNIFTSLYQYKYSNFQIELDGKEVFNGRVLSMNLGICKYNGGGLMQLPFAVPDDGELDVMVIKSTSRLNIVKHVSKLYDGSFVKLPFISTYRGKRCRIVSRPEGSVFLEADGESLGHSPLEFSVIPRALDFIIPGKGMII